MLCVLSESVAKGPQELSIPHGDGYVIWHGGVPKGFEDILSEFVREKGGFHVALKDIGGMAYTLHGHANMLPLKSFAFVDGIMCLFKGHLNNLAGLRCEYGLGAKSLSEVKLMIEVYKTLRDRGPYPADQVVSSLMGHFAFILFDSNTNNVFAAVDSEGSVPLFWGIAGDKSLVFSDDVDTVKSGCGTSFAPFPQGCYFSSNMGLKSFDHPLQKLNPVPRVDSQGSALGAAFKVDHANKHHLLMPRVGSGANWSSSI